VVVKENRRDANKLAKNTGKDNAKTRVPKTGTAGHPALIDKWNGQLPTVETGQSGGMILQLPKPQ